MRGRHTSAEAMSPDLRILADALPFRLVRRGREVVGCWFTSRADHRPRANPTGVRPGMSVFCHGMVRTRDGRVAGVSARMEMQPDMADRMLVLLGEATRESLPDGRRKAAEGFVASVRDAAAMTDAAWTPERERQELHDLRGLEGYGGWRPRADPEAALSAVKAFSAGRRRVLARFLDTLDQELVCALKPHAWDAEHTDEHDALLGEAWPLLDRTFATVAPLRSSVLPILGDFYAIQDLLHPLAAWSEDRDDIDDLHREERSLRGLRRFLPTEPSDLSDLPNPASW